MVLALLLLAFGVGMASAQTATSTTLSASANPVYVNESFVLTATVSGGAPSGTVTFKRDGVVLATTSVSAGTASMLASIDSAGTHNLTASYNGDGVHAPSTSAAWSQTVSPKRTSVSSLTLSTAAASSGQSVVLTARVTPGVANPRAPTGYVTFHVGSVNVGTATLSGDTAIQSIIAPCAGSHYVLATYSGDVAYESSLAGKELAVTARTTTLTLTSTPTTAYVGQTVRLSASLAGANPSGIVTFKDGAAVLGTSAVSGYAAGIDTVFSTAGTHNLSADYSGDACNTASTGNLSRTVQAATATTTGLAASATTADLNQSVSLTATVTGSNPTGTVAFQDGSTTIGTATVNAGVATLDTTFTSAGAHALVARYAGDGPNAPSASTPVTVTVNKNSTSTTATPSRAVVNQGEPFTLSAIVSGGTPAGSVTFKDGGTVLGTAPLTAGNASLAVSLSAVGAHSLTATYDGDSNHLLSNSSPMAVSVRAGPVPASSLATVVDFEYDAEGNPTKSVVAPGALNLQTVAGYDRLNRVKDAVDARNGQTDLEYDGLDRPTKVTDPKRLVTQYNRNGLGDVKQQVSPDTGTTNLSYDAAGNLKSYTDSRGVTAFFHYDVLNRPTMVSYAQAAQTTVYHQWQWDRADIPNGIGRLSNVLHPAGSWGYTYDAHGRVLSNRQQLNAVTGGNAVQITHNVAYSYDIAGNLTGITYPSGRRLSITVSGGVPTALGLSKDATSAAVPLISGIQWQPFGAAKAWNWHMAAGTQAHERAFDLAGRAVRYTLGTSLRDLSYDAAGRISRYTHYDATNGAAQPALDQVFAYDELGRLTQVTLNAGYWSFEYDANGNRTKATASGNASDYTIQATSNRIASITNPARSFSYDSVGNTTADGSFTATYDLPGRMKTLTKAGVTTTYTYDPEGKRIRKFSSTGAASTIVFVYDQWGHLLGEYDNTGKALREFVWLGDTPVAVFTPDPASATNPPLVYFIHTDHLNAPRVVMDKANKVRWRWIAEAFGVSAGETNPSGLGAFTFNLRFPGQYFDAESGLHDNWWRTYDPNVGRYTTSDPIGLEGGINTYAYVEGNPLSWTDPQGLQVPRRLTYQTNPMQAVHATQVNSLINQIRQFDPSFTYQTVRPATGPGSTYTRLDVHALSRLLRALQSQQVCSRDGVQAGRYIGDQRGNVMIEPVGGSTGQYGRNPHDTHTFYPNGSNYMRLNPQGHGSNNPTPHGHGHLPGTGTGRGGQGSSLDIFGNVVPPNSPAAHWPIN